MRVVEEQRIDRLGQAQVLRGELVHVVVVRVPVVVEHGEQTFKGRTDYRVIIDGSGHVLRARLAEAVHGAGPGREVETERGQLVDVLPG